MSLFDKILAARGLVGGFSDDFLHPDYSKKYDPMLLPDMKLAVERLKLARKKQEKIVIYGDYDIDGLTATTLLLDALESFGFKKVETFIPNRFVEGYGMTVDAVESICAKGASLIITVDCGSLSHKEISRAGELGVDVIVTDHHTVAEQQPPAIAVINPKRPDHKYPFIDLAGVGVAFKLVQALQTELNGLEPGAEKWLLDLVALGTVCDVVSLTDENRTNVYWGLEVLKKTRRPGLRALMAVARVEREALNARSLGFALGPRMNASGRLETAQHSLDMLISNDSKQALSLAQNLDEMNKDRRSQQDEIVKAAVVEAEKFTKDPVLVLSGKGWNHGIIGIVAAKMLERYQKPTFVLEEMGKESKGSARSYGDFSAVEAIRAADDLIISGGGHKLAAGVKIETKKIDTFRKRLNEFYNSQNLKNQQDLLLPKEDVVASFGEVGEEVVHMISQLEPFGNGNPEPILKTNGVKVVGVRKMGNENQHVKIEVQDIDSSTMSLVAFSAKQEFFVEVGDILDVWYSPMINEWRGRVSVEGRLVRLEPVKH